MGEGVNTITLPHMIFYPCTAVPSSRASDE